MKYCSQCNRSRYVKNSPDYPTELRCDRHEELGIRAYLPTDCTLAEMCPCFDPERWQDALTTRIQYDHLRKRCGIKKDDEMRGLLANVQLPVRQIQKKNP